MQFFSYSEAGHNHGNEDAIFMSALSCGVLVCLLADGQGGQPGGKEAAQCASKRSWDAVRMYSEDHLKDKFTWCEIIAAVDEVVSENDAAGFTTLITLGVTQNCIYGASVGDSMALLVKANEVIEITARQNKNPPVGSGAAIAKPFEIAIQAGEKLLVMSDGVWRYVSEENLAQAARNESGDALVQKLRQMQTEQNAGKLPDDFSVILVEF